jgi:hypothetical protein
MRPSSGARFRQKERTPTWSPRMHIKPGTPVLPFSFSSRRFSRCSYLRTDGLNCALIEPHHGPDPPNSGCYRGWWVTCAPCLHGARGRDRMLTVPPPPGPAGLASLKYLRHEGFAVTVFETRGDVGGLWAFSDDPHITSTTASTSTLISFTSGFSLTGPVLQRLDHRLANMW